MQVKNRRSGKIFPTTRHDFETNIVAKGFGNMYEVIEDDAPLEVKVMRERVIELKHKKSNPETDETK